MIPRTESIIELSTHYHESTHEGLFTLPLSDREMPIETVFQNRIAKPYLAGESIAYIPEIVYSKTEIPHQYHYTFTRYGIDTFRPENKTLNFHLRGRLIYDYLEENPSYEMYAQWKKARILFIPYPLETLIGKILLPITYLCLQALRSLFTISFSENRVNEAASKLYKKCEQCIIQLSYYCPQNEIAKKRLLNLCRQLDPEGHTGAFLRSGGLLRALVGIIVHPIISSLAIILYPCSSFFNKLNGNVERWINGHSLKDVEEKSVNSRGRECFYIGLCQQPLGLLKKALPEEERRLIIDDPNCREYLSLSVRKSLFRGIIIGDESVAKLSEQPSIKEQEQE